MAQAHPRGEAEIHIDGRLSEPIWAEAPESSGFVERQPTPRATPPVDTRFRVLYDGSALYVGMTMDLLPGEEPRALELRRDSFGLYSDDAVTVKIDVTHDHRTTVGFAVNPAGTQLDYIATDNGVHFRTEYDAVWESATRVEAGAWVAELRIPVAALGLSDGEGPRIFGFNVTRDHSARFATDDWSHLPPEFGPVSALHYGELRGVSDMGGGRPLSFVPYVLVRLRESAEHVRDDELRAGGDIRMRIAEDVWGELSVLTDFAQVDLDDEVVNLDRFPLLFPEKRPFFLSGIDVFEFADVGASRIYHSRRIGLGADGQEIPVLGGLKLYGHAGPLRFGALSVLTSEPFDASSWNVGRLRVDLGDASYVGLLLTAGPRPTEDALGAPGEPTYGLAYGLDTSIRTLDDRLELAGSLAAVDRVTDGELMSGYARVGYRTDVFRPGVSILRVGDRYDPPLGFVRRLGVLQTRLDLPLVFRPDGMRSIQIAAGAGADHADELDRRLGAEAELLFDADWGALGLGASAGLHEDVVEEAFDLLGTLPIASGTYRGVSMEYRFHTSENRNPWGSLRYRGSSAFFGGVVHTVEASGGLSLGAHLRLTLTASQSVLQLPGLGDTSPLAINSTLTIAPSTDLALDVLFRVNDVAETTAGLARLRWRYLPGSDLFVVYRQDLDFRGNLVATLTLKATFRYDLLL